MNNRRRNSGPFRAGRAALAFAALLGGMLCSQAAQPAERELRIAASLTPVARAELDRLVHSSAGRIRLRQTDGDLRILLPGRLDLAERLADWLRRHGLDARPFETVPVVSAGEAICIGKDTPRPLVQASSPDLLCSIDDGFDASVRALTLRSAPVPHPARPLGEHLASRAPPL